MIGCEYCGAEFTDETELHDYWSKTVNSPDHDLTDDELRAMLTEQHRRWNEHKVRVNVDVEIPREAWAWAVAHAGIDTPSNRIEDLPDPNDHPSMAIDLVAAEHHFVVVEDSDESEECETWDEGRP